ncbi:hypothetical protein B296_00037959 [Ensete ventricosum]|uniref:Peptidase M24 domain-containing protein n=1 Tax=Ensete ventricosum TaxID=4639 RepID=A0A426ZY25_ENSVE|nr:hypothetical protein B296_00037959 [Ensete ventricosum]
MQLRFESQVKDLIKQKSLYHDLSEEILTFYEFLLCAFLQSIVNLSRILLFYVNIGRVSPRLSSTVTCNILWTSNPFWHTMCQYVRMYHQLIEGGRRKRKQRKKKREEEERRKHTQNHVGSAWQVVEEEGVVSPNHIAREVLDAAARIIQPGITTDEIDEVVHQATIDAGGYPSTLNYHFFPKSCCTYDVFPIHLILSLYHQNLIAAMLKLYVMQICRSVNEVICHGIPDASLSCCRKLKDGDIVNVDVTVYYKGVHGELSYTLFC